MGISLFGHYSSDYTERPESKPPRLPNPDPHNYKVEKKLRIGELVVVKVRYPDCTNYEGLKIMVFKVAVWNKAEAIGHIDPHFSKNDPSPLARFIPTYEGWRMAIGFARTTQENR